MLVKKNFFKICIIFFCWLVSGSLLSADVLILKNIGYSSSEIKLLQQDIRNTILTIKSSRPVENLPELRFYVYEVKKKENFWTILARTGLDMDSLISINDLSSPRDISPGIKIFIPNMRGIVLSGEKKQLLAGILKNNKIHPRYVCKVNKSADLSKKYLFVPCGKISNLERSLFLGTAFLYPLKKGKKTSGFGSRRNPFNYKSYEFHSGIDLACPAWTKVFAARSGRVVFSGHKGGYGKLVIVKHEYNYYSYYGHLNNWSVKVGDQVRAGQLIAYSGNTGRTTGPHLHFEIRKGKRPVNPGALIHR